MLIFLGVLPITGQQEEPTMQGHNKVHTTHLQVKWLQDINLFALKDLEVQETGFIDRVNDFRALTTFGNGTPSSEISAFRERINHILYDNALIKNIDLDAGWLKHLRLYELRDMDENDIRFLDRVDDFRALTTFGNGTPSSEIRAFRRRINHMLFENEFIRNTDLNAGWLKQLRLYELRDMDESDIKFLDRVNDFRALTIFGNGTPSAEIRAFRERINHMLYDNEFIRDIDLKAGPLKHLQLYKLRNLDEKDIRFLDRVNDFRALTTFGNGTPSSEISAFGERIQRIIYDNVFSKNSDLDVGWLKHLQRYTMRDLEESNIGFLDRVNDFKALTTFGNGNLNSELNAFKKRLNRTLHDKEWVKKLDSNSQWLKQVALEELQNLDTNDLDFTERLEHLKKLATFDEGDIDTEMAALKGRINKALHNNEYTKALLKKRGDMDMEKLQELLKRYDSLW